MAKHNKLHNPKKSGFKKKTRGGNRVYIFRTDSTNKKGSLNGVVLEGAQVTVRTWRDDGGYFIRGLASPYDLIPIKSKKAHFDDLTQINVPFGELDKDTQKRLKEWQHGVDFLTFAEDDWRFTSTPIFHKTTVYRAIPEPVEKPKPEYEVGRFYPWGGGECPVPDDTDVVLLLSHYSDLVRRRAKYADWGKRDHNQIIAFWVVSYA